MTDPFSGPSDPDREVWFTLAYPDEIDLLVPPARYAVPARHAGVLEVMQVVTMGTSGRWWLLDQMVIVAGPTGHGELEEYEVAPLTEWGATIVRPEEHAGLPPDRCRPWSMPVRTADLWIYRPAPTGTDVRDLPVRLPLDNTQPDLSAPPAVRRPRPARELPALTGRAVTIPAPGPAVAWTTGYAVSEPINQDGQDGDLVVHVVSCDAYVRAGYGQLRDDEIRAVPLHHIWTY